MQPRVSSQRDHTFRRIERMPKRIEPTDMKVSPEELAELRWFKEKYISLHDHPKGSVKAPDFGLSHDKADIGLAVHLSQKNRIMWNSYKERHHLTDQEVFADILDAVNEENIRCWNCRTIYYARFNEVPDEVSCPKCELKTPEAWREYLKNHPKTRKEVESWFNKIGHPMVLK